MGLRFRKRLRFASLGLLLFLGTPSASAQFLGYTSPQTTQETLFDDVAVTGPSANVRNLGQSVHYLTYLASGTVTRLSIELQACSGPILTTCAPAGAGWIRISETATNAAQGAVFASGYFPLIRANITTLDGGGAVTAEYSGTSVATGPPVGIFNTSGINNKILANDLDADTTVSFDVELPSGGTGGILYFTFSAAGYAGATIEVSAGPDLAHLSEALPSTSLASIDTTQAVRVTVNSANVSRVTYTTAGATAVTYDLSYAFGGSQSAAVDVLSIAAGSNNIGNVNIESAGTNEEFFSCNSQEIVNLSASGNTQIVALSAGDVIRVCHISFSMDAVADVTFREGTGTNCDTDDTAISGIYRDANWIALDFGADGALRGSSGQALCVNLGTAVNAGGVITYAQF